MIAHLPESPDPNIRWSYPTKKHSNSTLFVVCKTTINFNCVFHEDLPHVQGQEESAHPSAFVSQRGQQ